MRVLVASAASLCVLAGCGGLGPSDNQALVSACVDEERAKSVCDCEAQALETNLPPELFKKFAQSVGREKQNQLEYLSTLPVEDLLAFSAVTNDLVACGSTAVTGG